MSLSKTVQNGKHPVVFSFISIFLTLQPLYAMDSVEDFLEMGLEDLLSMEVTSVSKKKQPLKEAAAAIFVISQEDIRRSGVTSIAEALRMVPGVQVARFDSNKWAITSRGFNSQFSNKLLVLIDGRSVYTPSFSGVYWDLQDTLLADIERIEVIRGPGASLWGANAVNGVINIITKLSVDTQGGLVSIGGGQYEEGFANLRYGADLGESTHGRFYLKGFNRGSFVMASDGSDAGDDWESQRGGFRIDSDPNEKNNWTVQGDLYNTDANQNLSSFWLDPNDFDPFTTAPGPTIETNVSTHIQNTGWNLLTRWNHIFSQHSDSSLQLYYDSTERIEKYITQEVDTLDIDFQHNLLIGDIHQLIWGMGYRQIKDDYISSFGVSINPPNSTTDLYSVFMQDQIELLPESFYLTLGSKLEHNDYTGIEIQPSIRGLWKASDTSTLWGSVSRAIRTPSRIETHGRIITFAGMVPITDPPSPPWMPVFRSINGSEDFDSEKTLAYELGYRIQPLENLSVDLTTFYNDYDDLLTFEETAQQNITFANKMSGHASGFELALDWRARNWWKVKAAYSMIKFNLQLDSDSQDQGIYSVRVTEGASPEHQLTLRSTMNLPDNWELDFWLYYVNELPVASVTASIQDIIIDSYTSLNMHVGWRPINNIELSLSGFNLLDQRHSELVGEYTSGITEVERAIYAKIRWDF